MNDPAAKCPSPRCFHRESLSAVEACYGSRQLSQLYEQRLFRTVCFQYHSIDVKEAELQRPLCALELHLLSVKLDLIRFFF